MDQWIELRRKIRNQEVPLRQLQRETGIHRQTLRKIRDNSQPPGYQRTKSVEKTKIGPYLDRIVNGGVKLINLFDTGYALFLSGLRDM